MLVFRGFVILKPQKPDLKCPPLRSGQYLAEKLFLFCVCRGLRENEPSQALRASSPEGRAKTVEGTLLASPFERLPPVGGRCRTATKRDKVSPKVTERALPLPCGELPPQRLRGLSIGEAKKKCNGDDRRQRRIQGGAVGAAVSRTRVPLKARSGRWAPQPV